MNIHNFFNRNANYCRFFNNTFKELLTITDWRPVWYKASRSCYQTLPLHRQRILAELTLHRTSWDYKPIPSMWPWLHMYQRCGCVTWQVEEFSQVQLPRGGGMLYSFYCNVAYNYRDLILKYNQIFIIIYNHRRKNTPRQSHFLSGWIVCWWGLANVFSRRTTGDVNAHKWLFLRFINLN